MLGVESHRLPDTGGRIKALPIVFFETRSGWSSNMRNLVAGLVLIMSLPMVCMAEEADTKSEAFTICLRATQRFDQQETANGTGKTALAPLSASCKSELKPASYWQCMDREAIAKVDFNVAHTHCAI
jgi:hypothetical protein